MSRLPVSLLASWILSGFCCCTRANLTDEALGAERAAPVAPASQPALPALSSASEAAPAPPSHSPFPSTFQLTSMRGTSHQPYLTGNTLDSVRAAYREGIESVEVDLVLTRDGELVAAHEANLAGCGTLSRMRLNQALGCKLKGGLKVADLKAVLELPFKSIFLDLKDTQGPDPERAARAVERAASQVVAQGRQRETVLMLYDTPTPALASVRRHRVRAGLKGYPSDVDQARSMTLQASQVGFELVSVNTKVVTPELIAWSAERGVWQLPWSTDPTEVAHWRALASAGAGGLIVLHYDLAQSDVVPHFVPLVRARPKSSP